MLHCQKLSDGTELQQAQLTPNNILFELCYLILDTSSDEDQQPHL